MRRETEEVILWGMRKEGGREAREVPSPAQPLNPDHFPSCGANPSAPLSTPITTTIRALTTCDCLGCTYTRTPAGRAGRPQLSLFTRFYPLPHLPQGEHLHNWPQALYWPTAALALQRMEGARGPSFPFFSQRPYSMHLGQKDAVDPQPSRETEGRERRPPSLHTLTVRCVWPPSPMIPGCAKNIVHSISLQAGRWPAGAGQRPAWAQAQRDAPLLYFLLAL